MGHPEGGEGAEVSRPDVSFVSLSIVCQVSGWRFPSKLCLATPRRWCGRPLIPNARLVKPKRQFAPVDLTPGCLPTSSSPGTTASAPP